MEIDPGRVWRQARHQSQQLSSSHVMKDGTGRDGTGRDGTGRRPLIYLLDGGDTARSLRDIVSSSHGASTH